MNFEEIARLFCCPPVPSEIVNKIAFLQPLPSYSIINNVNGKSQIVLNEAAEWQYGEAEKEQLEVFSTRTSRGHNIACMHVRCVSDPLYTILYSNGNAVDLGMMSSFFVGLGTRLNCNFLGYDYSGYGVSEGKSSGKNVYADIRAAYGELRNRYGVSNEKIILYGNSFGTIPTVDLAKELNVAGIVLQTPITSFIRLVFPDVRRSLFFDCFKSIDKISR